MRLIEDIGRKWYRLASMWFLMIAASFAAWTAAYPDDYRALLDQLPEGLRPVIAFAVFALFGSATRLIRFREPIDAGS